MSTARRLAAAVALAAPLALAGISGAGASPPVGQVGAVSDWDHTGLGPFSHSLAATSVETPSPSRTATTVSGPRVQTDQLGGDAGAALVPLAALGAFALVAGAGALATGSRTDR
ncbi:hypothetical protein [Luteipulveratus halotolerans]|uniref:Gram-positive cocci surface proteins LPxTG domain-containing protein n=1 Tax=Luteipulveratus halotolerans TaxID=1631356 RepID=A0A0L6CLX9_9MICO|nr:hypothetical protein [Luteipulveratus halotolerans]KNX38739.1 hypothetical protein VV01_18890 [Luteipulveratus halotolerans]